MPYLIILAFNTLGTSLADVCLHGAGPGRCCSIRASALKDQPRAPRGSRSEDSRCARGSVSFPAKDVRLTLEPPSRGNHPLERDAVEQADGTWLVNDVLLAEPGTWTVRVYVRPDHGDRIPLDAPIVIER
jgi:hypothetical protein